MKKGIKLLALFFVVLFLSNMAFAGGPDLKAKPKPASPWMVYTGLFTGNYSADFLYGGNYFSSALGNLIFNSTVAQRGASGGFQVGTQFHLQNPFYFGAVLSGMTTTDDASSDKARLSSHVDDSISSTGRAFCITDKFRINYNLDLAGVFGADITPQTHVYAKAGTSYARFSVKTAISSAVVSPFPMISLQKTEYRYFWGWLFGVGLTHDINKWVSVFAEYDYYDYGSHNFNALNNIAPSITAAQQDRLIQHAAISANSVLLGLNLKFMDTFSPFHYLGAISPWMLYVGGFGGNYSADFSYEGTYFSNNGSPAVSPGNSVYNDEAAQKGASVGGQIGVQYHLQSPGYFGIVFSSMINSEKARIEEHVENTTAAVLQTAFVMSHEFHISYNTDLALVIGADVTPHTHIYLKAGASHAQMIHHQFQTNNRNAPVPIPLSQLTEHKNIWGWVAGLGLTYDISQWISVFAEYDHYDYGNHNLISLDNVDPSIGGAAVIDHLVQTVGVRANSVRLGLNLKFMDTYSATQTLARINPWILYVGGFGGYYDANYRYGAVYFGNSVNIIANQILNGDVLQQGASAGGQFGFQYHLQSPYYVGMVFSSMMNANKARLAEDIENGVSGSIVQMDLNYQFRINYNLDLAAIFGVDITPETHLYAKAGVSGAQFSLKFFTTDAQLLTKPVVAFQHIQHDFLWGWLFGLGLTRDINKWVSLFVEYDYYDYGVNNLDALRNIAPRLSIAFPAFPGQTDLLTHHAGTTANSVRLGLNVNFAV